jgi:hypothetical protein
MGEAIRQLGGGGAAVGKRGGGEGAAMGERTLMSPRGG